MKGQELLDNALKTPETVEADVMNKLIEQAQKPEQVPVSQKPKAVQATRSDLPLEKAKRRVIDEATQKYCPILTRGGSCMAERCVAFELKETKTRVTAYCGATAINKPIAIVELPKSED